MEPRSPALSPAVALRDGLSCAGCAHLGACMPAQAASVRLIGHRLLLRRHQPLLEAGDVLSAVYSVRSGLLKGLLKTGVGPGLVTGLFFPGDVAGLDGIAQGRHPTGLRAVTDAEICVVPFARLEAWAGRSPVVQRHLHRLLSREITRACGASLPLSRLTAAQRVAAFLLRFGAEQSRDSGSASEFVMALTLEEMGSHLGLTMETVSRVLSQLVAQRLIAREGRRMRILAPMLLDRLARPQHAGAPAAGEPG